MYSRKEGRLGLWWRGVPRQCGQERSLLGSDPPRGFLDCHVPGTWSEPWPHPSRKRPAQDVRTRKISWLTSGSSQSDASTWPAELVPLANSSSPIQRPYWDATTLLLLSLIKVAMGTMAFFVVLINIICDLSHHVAARVVTMARFVTKCQIWCSACMFCHSSTFCYYMVTKRAERSTRCTFCHSFASNTII